MKVDLLNLTALFVEERLPKFLKESQPLPQNIPFPLQGATSPSPPITIQERNVVPLTPTTSPHLYHPELEKLIHDLQSLLDRFCQHAIEIEPFKKETQKIKQQLETILTRLEPTAIGDELHKIHMLELDIQDAMKERKQQKFCATLQLSIEELEQLGAKKIYSAKDNKDLYQEVWCYELKEYKGSLYFAKTNDVLEPTQYFFVRECRSNPCMAEMAERFQSQREKLDRYRLSIVQDYHKIEEFLKNTIASESRELIPFFAKAFVRHILTREEENIETIGIRFHYFYPRYRTHISQGNIEKEMVELKRALHTLVERNPTHIKRLLLILILQMSSPYLLENLDESLVKDLVYLSAKYPSILSNEYVIAIGRYLHFHPHLLSDNQFLLRVIQHQLNFDIVDVSLLSRFIQQRPSRAELQSIFGSYASATDQKHYCKYYSKPRKWALMRHKLCLGIRLLLVEEPHLRHAIIHSNLPQTFDRHEYSPFEWFYNIYKELDHNKMLQQHVYSILKILMKSGHEIPTLQLKIMQRELNHESSLYRYLDKHHLFPKEIEADDSRLIDLSPEDVIQILRSQTKALGEERRRIHTTQGRANFPFILQQHNNKMRIKRLFANKEWCSRYDREEIAELQKSYLAYVEAYDKVIEHLPILRDIRGFSRELRQLARGEASTTSIGLLKFVVMWDPHHNFHRSYEAVRREVMGASDVYLGQLKDMRRRVVDVAHRFFSDPFWQRYDYRRMVVHGTKIGTLTVMRKMKPNERGLYAAGELLKRGIAPFAGELVTAYSHNEEKISCTVPSRDKEERAWEISAGDASVYIYDVPTSLMQSYLYAMKRVVEFGAVEENITLFDPEKAWKLVSEQNVKNALSNAKNMKLFSNIHISILRLRLTDPKADEKLALIKEFVEQERQKPSENKTQWEHLHKALTLPVPFQLTSEEIRELQDNTPVVFATFNRYTDEQQAWNREIRLPSGLRLEEDLPAIFAFEENREQVEKAKGDAKVEVRSIDELLFAEMLMMIEGSILKRAADMDTLTSENIQERLDAALQAAIAPIYGTPFPQEPTYTQEASFEREGPPQRVQQPFYGPQHQTYQEYKQSVDLTEVPARDIHGMMHMVRTSIWSQLIANILSKENQGPQDRFLLAFAAASHDSKRQDEAQDRWDHTTAATLRSYLHTLGDSEGLIPGHWNKKYRVSKEKVESLYNALAHKDPPEGEGFTSLEQKAVHDADCLEIHRCLTQPEQFRPDKLVIHKSMATKDLEELIREVQAFIKLTETTELKNYLEYTTEHPYLTIMHLLRLQVHAGNCPTIEKYLQQELKTAPIPSDFDPVALRQYLPNEVAQRKPRASKLFSF